jgi:hypothetical protein
VRRVCARAWSAWEFLGQMLRLLSPTWSNGPAIGIWKSSHVVRQRRGVFSRIRVNQPEYRIVINVTVYSYYTYVFFFSKKNVGGEKEYITTSLSWANRRSGRIQVWCAVVRLPAVACSSGVRDPRDAFPPVQRRIELYIGALTFEPWKSCWLTARCWPMIRAVCWPASSMLWQRFGRCRFRGWCVPCVEYGEVMPRGNPRHTGHGGGDGH